MGVHTSHGYREFGNGNKYIEIFNRTNVYIYTQIKSIKNSFMMYFIRWYFFFKQGVKYLKWYYFYFKILTKYKQARELLI